MNFNVLINIKEITNLLAFISIILLITTGVLNPKVIKINFVCNRQRLWIITVSMTTLALVSIIGTFLISILEKAL